jgi:hypothetical protein
VPDLRDLYARRSELAAEAARLDAELLAAGPVPPAPYRAAPARSWCPSGWAAVLTVALTAGWVAYHDAAPRRPTPPAPTAPDRPAPVPTPAPVSPDLAPLRDAAAAYRADFARAHGAIADQVEAGEVTTLDQLVGSVKLARAAAAAPLVKALDSYVRSKCDPQGNVTDKKAVAGALRAARAGLSGGD